MKYAWKGREPERMIVSDRERLAPKAQMVRAFGMNPKVGGSSPQLGRGIFNLKNFQYFHNISSWV